MEHMEGKTSLRTVMEVAEEGGRGTDRLRKFLTHGGPGGDTLWVGNLGVDGNYSEKNRGGTREFHATGDGDEGLEDGGQYLAKGGFG